MTLRLLIIALSALCWVSAVAQDRGVPPEDILATHWLPQTAADARRLTLAAAHTSVTAQSGDLESSFAEHFQAQLDVLDRWMGSTELSSTVANGRWGHWVLSHESDFSKPLVPLALSWSAVTDDLTSQWPLLQALAAREVIEIWSHVDAIDIEETFAPLVAVLATAPADDVSHARAQARRLVRMKMVRAAQTRNIIEGSLLLAQAQFEWARGEYLDSAWLVLEGLMGLDGDSRSPNARFYVAWLESLPAEQVRGLRAIDVDFPLIMALLQDSANHWLSGGQDRPLARAKLAQAYARLALMGTSIDNYLDQPVREQLNTVYQSCQQALMTTDEAQQAACRQAVAQQLSEGLGSEELVGATGPLSLAFLNRELGLVSWQRARYLDSYLNWQLSAQCAIPGWFNGLEWSLGVEYLLRADLGSSDNRATSLEPLHEQKTQFWNESIQWLDCITGQGGRREDALMRLLSQYEQSLNTLDQAITQANATFDAQTLSLGADVALDQPLSPDTAYLNSALTIGPCDESRTCGARVMLPTDQALLALVPSGYWLAEQLKMGQVRLCYDNVEWVDRMQSPARHNDSGVANYSGRLSFELHAYMDEPQQSQLIFAKRLNTDERRNYFFGRADDQQLALSCAHGLEGQPIQSELSDQAGALVPTRLTYFTSMPTTVASHLMSHWAQGANWREQFLDEGKIETIAFLDDDEIFQRAEAQRLSLVDRRERALATRLSNFETGDDADPLRQAMFEVEIASRLIGQVMALHFAQVVRFDEDIRARLWGEEGLLSRVDIRRARDQGTLMRDVPGFGKQRLEMLSDAWRRWPIELRQLGTLSPELQMADALLKTASGDLFFDGVPPKVQ